MAKFNFSVNSQIADNDGQMIVENLTKLTRMAIDKYNNKNFLYTQYTCSDNYNELEADVKKAIIKYCAEKSGLSHYNFDSKDALGRAFTKHDFAWTFFDIQTQALNAVQADNELEDALKLANIVTVSAYDSISFEIGGKNQYEVQDGQWSNNVSRYQGELKSSVTLAPLPKIAKVEIDVVQMLANNYDFGKHMAKIAMSFRTKMYIDIVNEIYTVTNVPSAFHESSFAKTSYAELADRIAAANSAGVMALATRSAWMSAANTVANGFSTQDEINKTGFIGNLYGVSSSVLDQVVDSNSASYSFRVPNDRIILLSAIGDRPVKVAKGGNIMVTDEIAQTGSLYNRVYSYQDAWDLAIATQGHYGIQEV